MADSVGSLTIAELAPCLVRTSTFTGAAYDVRDFVGRVRVVQFSAAASAGDTLDGKIQDSPDGTTGWADLTGATFTQVTAAADGHEAIAFEASAAKPFIRYVGTVAGASPSWPFGATVIGTKQYR